MDCKAFDKKLEEFLKQRLDRQSMEEMQIHVQACRHCCEQLEDAQFAQAVVSVAVPHEEWVVSPQFFSHFWQALEENRSKEFSWAAVRDLSLRFVMGVILIMALLIGIAVFSGPRATENQVAIENYLEAPGATDSFRQVLVGDLHTNRDQLLDNLLQRDLQPSTPSNIMETTNDNKK